MTTEGERGATQERGREPPGPQAPTAAADPGSRAPGPARASASPASRAAAPGRGLAALALLLALLAAAAAAYLYLTLVYQPDPLGARLAVLERRVADLEGAATATAVDPEVVRGQIERAVAEARAALRAELRAAPPAGAPSPAAPDQLQGAAPRDWQLAEIRYLLRMANHRLLLERDAPGAAALLRAADQVLVGLGDFGLHDVRARVAEEILALESLPAVDAEGLFLQLEAIKRDLDQLPLRLPELQPAPSAAEPPTGWLDALWGEVTRLVRFRQFDGAVRPLLAPEEAVYLELNLRLMLERAQLAGLRREQPIYDQSIAVAVDWIERYLDVSTPQVARVLEGLRALQGVSLAAPLPDISGSLAALEALAVPSGPAP
jgi:uroporphyrin-3 C-methyltransferase